MKVDDKTLLAMCLTGKTQTQMARDLHMTKTQISRRINMDSFQGMLSDYRKRVLDGVLTELTAYTQKAVQTLIDLLDDENSFIRLKAATEIIRMSQEYGIAKDIMKDIEVWKASLQEAA